MALPITAILDRQIDFDPTVDFETFARAVPAKWVVYLLADATGQPVQLLCVKNLRHSLKRRLGGDDVEVGPTRRVNYRDLVRRIYYKRVDSAFEADCVYYEAAQICFPQTYSGMVGFRPAWFVHVDPDADFPRFTKTTDLTPRPGRFIGPVEDKHAAQSLIELAEDSFDLCRYYNVLTEAPRAKPCAYKEMGRCPAPCDGSIGMDSYRGMVGWAADTLIDPSIEIARHTKRMQAAAMELKFEVAAKIKALIDTLSKLGKGPFRHVQLLNDFAYLSLQRGPSHGDVNVFLITPGQIDLLLCLTDVPERCSEALRFLLHAAAQRRMPLDVSGNERMGIVAHHLFSAKATQGVFLPLRDVNEKSFVKAYRDVLKQKLAADSDDDEGVMKELQAI